MSPLDSGGDKPRRYATEKATCGAASRLPTPQDITQGTDEARAKREKHTCVSPEVVAQEGDECPRETTIAGLDKTALLIDIVTNTNAVTAKCVMVTANSDKEIPCETNGTIPLRSAY